MKRLLDIIKNHDYNYKTFVAVVAVGFLLLWIIGPGNTFIDWIKTAYKINKQEKQIKEYKQEIKEMKGYIHELETNKDSLEKFAREKFHFAKEGEDVYLIMD